MNRLNRITLFLIPGVIVVLIFVYVGYAYHFLPNRVHSLRITFDRQVYQKDFVVYISDSTEAFPNLIKPFFARVDSDSVVFVEFGKSIRLRQFRLYFQGGIENGAVREISLIGSGVESRIKLSQVASNLIQLQSEDEDSLNFRLTTNSGYAYIETPRFYYPSDYWLLSISIVVAVGLSFAFYFLIGHLLSTVSLNSISWSEWSVVAFILSILLPQVLFNITLAVSAVLIARNFRFNQFTVNKLNLLYLSLFLVYFLNFLFFSTFQNISHFEKYLALLAVPIYASCINGKRLLIFFSVSALLIGGTVLVGALVNIAIFRNLETVSTDFLTGIIHRVYYSYLLVFSIIYIELGTNLRYKRLINIVLFILLVLSGSKLVIFCMLILSLFLFRASVKVVLVPLLLLSLVLFSPLRNNFGLIADPKDLSVLSEQHISNPTDSRLNGFTLRLILWQENIRVDRLSQLVIGNGIGPEGKAVLESKLRERGLMNHLWYNAHNQYLTTFFHAGLVGLIPLLFMMMYSIWLGFKSGNRVLFFFSIVIAMAMMSESVFERVSGIALFSLILLLLANDQSRENLKFTTSQSLTQ